MFHFVYLFIYLIWYHSIWSSTAPVPNRDDAKYVIRHYGFSDEIFSRCSASVYKYHKRLTFVMQSVPCPLHPKTRAGYLKLYNRVYHIFNSQIFKNFRLRVWSPETLFVLLIGIIKLNPNLKCRDFGLSRFRQSELWPRSWAKQK